MAYQQLYRLTLGDNHSFVILSSEEMDTALSYCESSRPCLSCGLSFMENIKSSWASLPGGGYSHQGVDYHVNDFVYLHQPRRGTAGLLDIAQITEFIGVQGDDVCLRVRFYGRYDDAVQRSGGGHPHQRDNVGES